MARRISTIALIVFATHAAVSYSQTQELRNPFGEKIRNPTEQQKRQTQERELTRLRMRASQILEQMESRKVAADQPERILAQLQAAEPTSDRLRLHRALVALPWTNSPVVDQLKDISAAWLKEPSRETAAFIEIGRDYKTKMFPGAEPFVFDWRARRQYWQAHITALIASRTASDPADVWRARIGELTNDADRNDCRLAYLAVVEHAGADVVINGELLGPLFRAKDSEGENLRRLGQVVAVARKRKDAGAGLMLKQLRERLPAFGDAKDRSLRRAAESLGRDVGRTLLSDMLTQAHPHYFARFAAAMGLSRNEIASQFLSKPMKIQFSDVPKNIVVRELLDRVELSVWVDQELANDKELISFRGEGAWKDVVRQILSPHAGTFNELSNGTFYLGGINRLGLATRTFDASERTIPSPYAGAGVNRTAHALRFDSRAEFVDTPLIDAAQFLSDFNAVPIYFIDDIEATVSFQARRIPLHLVLTLLCEQVDVQWRGVGDGVILFKNDSAPRIEEWLRWRGGRQLRIRQMNQPLVQWLRTPGELRFLDTPLTDVAAFLHDAHKISIAIAALPEDQQLSGDFFGLDIGWGLDQMLLPADLRWESDGASWLIGRAEHAKRLAAAGASRTERRKAYPPGLQTALAGKPSGVFRAEGLSAIVSELSDRAKISVRIDEKLRDKPVSLFLTGEHSLDVALDALAAAVGAQWRIEGKTVVVSRD